MRKDGKLISSYWDKNLLFKLTTKSLNDDVILRCSNSLFQSQQNQPKEFHTNFCVLNAPNTRSKYRKCLNEKLTQKFNRPASLCINYSTKTWTIYPSQAISQHHLILNHHKNSLVLTWLVISKQVKRNTVVRITQKLGANTCREREKTRLDTEETDPRSLGWFLGLMLLKRNNDQSCCLVTL